MSVFAGLVGGLGQGMVSVGEQMRQEARDRKKRQQDLEDENRRNSEYDRRTNDERGYQDNRRRDTISRGASALSGGGDLENATYVKNRFVELGYPEHVAAGLVGNIMQESGPGIDTQAVGDGGNAYGMAQWNGPRRKAYMAWAETNGRDPADIDAQIEYIDYEFRTTEASAYDAVMKTQTAEEAALVASEKFWRPGIPHNERRQAYARQLMEVIADPEMPAQVREAAADKLDSLDGKPTSKKITGEEWVERDGMEVLMGRDENGTMRPYTDESGKPITRAIKPTSTSPKSLNDSQRGEIADWAARESLDDNAARKFQLKTESFMQQGMTFTEAWDATLAIANQTEDRTETTEGFLGFGGSERTIPGGYDGTFREPEGLGPAPSRTAQSTPSSTPKPPSEPTSSGMPAPKTKAELDKLPSGTRYIDPEGNIRVKS